MEKITKEQLRQYNESLYEKDKQNSSSRTACGFIVFLGLIVGVLSLVPLVGFALMLIGAIGLLIIPSETKSKLND